MGSSSSLTEVYRGLELDPSDRLPAFADVNDRAVSLGVMSKAYGLAGLRIGWIATHDERLFRELAAFKDYATICNSAPSEFLATIALRHTGVIVERNLRIIRDNLDRLDAFFGSHADKFGWYRPKAGSMAFPALLLGDVDEFCTDLVEKAGVTTKQIMALISATLPEIRFSIVTSALLSLLTSFDEVIVENAGYRITVPAIPLALRS